MNTMLAKATKRSIDILGAGLALFLLAPIILLTALMVARKLGVPVLFCQDRPGRDGRVFRMMKFRTMTDERDAKGELLPDGERLTRFGRWLRATSLDELPELLNVLKGDMSLVGPRPLLTAYLPYYTAEQRRRHEVKPGITGHAQVNGRNNSGWEERLAQDVWYVENWSLRLDVGILLKTISRVIYRDDINADGHATMPRFDDFVREKSANNITNALLD